MRSSFVADSAVSFSIGDGDGVVAFDPSSVSTTGAVASSVVLVTVRIVVALLEKLHPSTEHGVVAVCCRSGVLANADTLVGSMLLKPIFPAIETIATTVIVNIIIDNDQAIIFVLGRHDDSFCFWYGNFRLLVIT